MPSHATFYLPDSLPLSAEALRRHAAGAEIRECRSGLLRRLHGIEVTWPNVRMYFKAMDARELPEHLAGFVGFVHAKAASDARKLVQRIRAVRQVVGAVVDPGPDAAGHVERLVLSLAADRQALVVREAGVFDEHGQLVVDPSGAAIRAATGAAPEPVVLREPAPVPALEPPAPDHVLRRALALAAISLRGQLEYDSADGQRHLKHLCAAILRHGLGGELEEQERWIVTAPLGAPTPHQATSASWRAEGLAVLAWALRVAELPEHDQLAGRDQLAMMGWLLAEALPPDAAAPVLRPASELEAMRKQLLGVHWRLRDYGIRPRAMDFAAFSRKCWFGSFDLMGIRLVDGDLAIGDTPIHGAAAAAVSRTNSIAVERHHAINWLCGEAKLYGDVDTST